MTRSSRRLAVASALAGVVLAVAVGSEAAQHPSCAVAGSTTVFANTDVRVFTRVVQPGSVTRTVACRRSDAARFRLAQGKGDPDYVEELVDDFFPAGRRLGYAVLVNARFSTTGRACALNLDTGRRRCARTLWVRGLGVTPKGSIAWLEDVAMEEQCCGVHKLDAGASKPVQLDQGTGIDRTSFAVGGTHIYWTNAGQTQTATMP